VIKENPDAWPDVPEYAPLGPIPEKGTSDPSMVMSESLSHPAKSGENIDFCMDPQNSPWGQQRFDR
jgi:hypothetical protein